MLFSARFVQFVPIGQLRLVLWDGLCSHHQLWPQIGNWNKRKHFLVKYSLEFVNYSHKFQIHMYILYAVTLVLRKINFEWFYKSLKICVLPIRSSEFWNLVNFWHFPKTQNSIPQKLLKWHFFTIWNQPKLVSRKTWVTAKSLNFHTMQRIGKCKDACQKQLLL